MADERDEIRSRIDIVDLISRDGVRLKKTGKNHTGLCPFHNEKRPSFTVNSETGTYRCWSCGERGDIFTWVMKRQNVDFVDALRQLAHEAGVTLSHSNEPRTDRELHQTIMDAALDFFREQLTRSTTAQEYCAGRGLDAATLEAWQIGYAPDVGEALVVHFNKKGISLAEARTLFLVDLNSQERYYDKFRGRLMFPIRDEKGALVAFGGRLLGDGHPKYINSGDTPLYRKSRVLYGMNRARESLQKDRRAVLCEGYLDVIACHRAGVTSALASLGTSMTEDQAKLLKKWCDEVVILYDSDPAGQKAAARAVEVIRPEGMRVRVALMPTGDDPDTLLKREGADAVRRAVEAGLTPVDYRLQTIEREYKPDQEEFWQQAFEALSEATTEPEILRHVDRLKGLYPGTRDPIAAAKAIRAEVNRLGRAKRARAAGPEAEFEEAPSRPRPGPAITLKGTLIGPERMVFRALLSEQYRMSAYFVSRVTDLFQSGIAVEISEAIKASFPTGAPVGPPNAWLGKLNPEPARQWLSDILMHPWDEPLTEEAIAQSIERLKENRERRQRLEMLRNGGDPSEYLQRLRQAKPDLKAKPKEDDDLF
ncbi:MAG: DNA primase [Fimbriimonas sp.]